MTDTVSMPLAAQLVAGLGAAEPDRLPPEMRAYAESALARVAATRLAALVEPDGEDLLSRTARLAMTAHERSADRGCVVAAAAIGATATWGAPGSTVVGAVALGLELEQRLARGLGPGHQEAGWCVGGTAGPPAAALTAALVARTTPGRVAHAIGIASSLTLGHAQACESDVGALHVGKAAANGLLAAALAVQGSTASATALEGPRGYFHALGADAAAEVVLDGLGQRWSIETPVGERPSARKVTAPFVAELRSAVTAGRARELSRLLLGLPAEEVK